MELNKIFKDGLWSSEINVRDFVSHNITPYYGDASFLEGPTERTKAVWNRCLEALAEERENNGVRSLDNVTVSTITSHKAGIYRQGKRTDRRPAQTTFLKRAIKPFGGINVVSKACHENGVEVDDRVKDIFTHYRKTHNDGVFDVYTRRNPFLPFAGIPYRTSRQLCTADASSVTTAVRLFTASTVLSRSKEGRFAQPHRSDDTLPVSRLREEVAAQIKALKDMKVMVRILRSRPEPSRLHGTRSRTVGIYGLPCRRQRTRPAPPCHRVTFLLSSISIWNMN